MSEAKQRRSQHFQSQVFPDSAPADTRPNQHRRSDTYTSTVFASGHEAAPPTYSNPPSTNYARRKYNAETSAFQGAMDQAAEYRERQEVRVEPTEMKRAGKKANPVADYEYKPRHIRTQSSTVFTPGDEASARYNPHKPQDAYDMLGNESSQYYRKSINQELPEPPSRFEPRYRQVPAHDMKHREFYGSDAPEASYPSEEQPQARTPTDRRLEYLNSSVFPSDNVRGSVTPTRAVVRPQTSHTPEIKSQQDQTFTIFGESKTTSYPTKRQVAQPALRPSHQMSSSLFGRDFDYSPSHAPEKLPASTVDWRNVGSEVHRKDREFTASAMAQDQLRSNLDPADRYYGAKENGEEARPAPVRVEGRHAYKNLEMASRLHTDDFYERAYPDSDPVVMDFDLSGLDPRMNSHELKRLCGNVHLISASTDVDPLKDRCTGTGRIQVRVTKQTESSLQYMKTILADEGIALTPHRDNPGRRNNLSGAAGVYWNDSRVEIEGRKRDEDLPPAKIAMMKNLESHGKVFNGAAGTWSEEWKQSAVRNTKDSADLRVEREALSSWNHTRKQG